MSDSLSRAIVTLFQQERFYAEVILGMDRFLSNKVPTAGVCIKDNIQLYVNPAYFDSISLEERVAVLKHECQHILNDHIGRSKEMLPDLYDDKQLNTDPVDDIIKQQKHTVVNIACDLSINPGILNLPKGAVLPEQFELDDGLIMEQYFESLKNNDKAKQMTQLMDDHSLWAESAGDKEELRAKVRQLINGAAEKAKAAGKMTSEEELMVERLNYRPKDWKNDLRRFASHAMEVFIDISKKKRNRRYGIQYPGIIKEEKLHIGVAIDTSGSISDEALCQFMAEIANIAKYAVVTVVEADTEVKNSYLFDPKKVYKVKGRGGTAYQPAFEYFTDKTEVDGVIYFGDMDCFDTEELKKPKYPVLWAILGNQEPPASWGRRTKVEVIRK